MNIGVGIVYGVAVAHHSSAPRSGSGIGQDPYPEER